MEKEHWWANTDLNKKEIDKFEHAKQLVDKLTYASEIIANNHNIVLEINYDYVQDDAQVLFIFKKANMPTLSDIKFLAEEINEDIHCCEVECDRNWSDDAYLTYYIQSQEEYNECEKRMQNSNLNESLSSLQLNSIDDIEFAELRDLSDDEGVIFMGVTFGNTLDDVERAIPEVDAFFKQAGLIKSDAKVIGLHKILGNILGDDGRTDWLVEFAEPSFVAPMVRLRMGSDIKWISDFINNYKRDYNE